MDNQVTVVPQNQAIKPNTDAEVRLMTPVYVWKTGKTMFLSKKEKVVADCFIATRSYAECARALNKEGWKKNWMTCKRWLEKPHMQGYLVEQMEERGVYAGWTKEHWFKVMTDHLMGRERLANGDLYGMNLIGKYKGWEVASGPGVVTQINFMQANGKA